MEIVSVIALVVGLILGGIIVWLYRNATDKGSIAANDHDALKAKLQAVETSLAVSKDREATLEQQRDQLTANADAWRDKCELATRELEVTRSRFNSQKNDFDEIKSKLEAEFRVIANSILDTSSQKLTQQQSEKLNDLLLPFRQQIDGFKKDIDTKFTHEATEKGSLKQQIESLVSLNQSIAKEALALTEALRGSTKKQGDWGEDILERILEYSGLQKDVQYFVQPQSQNEEGKSNTAGYNSALP